MAEFEGTDELKTEGLQKLYEALEATKKLRVRIGILGDKNVRKDPGPTNAEIGAKHEFGSDGVPMRSFLRQPMIDNYEKFLMNAKFERVDMEKIVKEGDLTVFMEKLGIVGEAVVADAFATGGGGKWVGWKSGYQNNTGMILVDTTQLRNSITSDVKG